MTWIHFYRLSDGNFVDLRWRGMADDLAANTPDGCAAWTGDVDALSQRVDLATGQLVDYQPPAPPDTEWETWAWDAGIKRWQATPTQAARARTARLERDRRLAQCDWVTTRALDLAQPVPAPWAAYRQALRDVPEQPGFPDDITWPTSPET